jgi:SNF2 family DNA or RNA helicase
VNEVDDLFNADIAPASTTEDAKAVLAALKWSKPKEVSTSRGQRLVSNADPTPEFRKLFSERPQWLREQGYTFGFSKYLNKEQVTFWQLLPEKVLNDRKQSEELSRAVDANVELLAPEGLAYAGFQKAGIVFGRSRPGCLIADEMGLGKTIQAIGILNQDPTIKRTLIICPASLKLNWQRELRKWLVRPCPILIADSKLFHAIVGITIINYDILTKHIDEIRAADWDYLIIDEAHYLKNYKAQRTKMVFGSRATKEEKAQGMADVPGIGARRKVFLTGTPIQNRPMEIFGMISNLDPVAWPNAWRFMQRYGEGQNLDELQEKLRQTIMIRRLKKDVLTELPPKRRKVIEFTATGEARHVLAAEKSAYAEQEEAMEEAQARVELAKCDDNEEGYGEAIKSLKAVVKVAFEQCAAARYETVMAKIRMPEVVEFIDGAIEESGKVIIFGHHKDALRFFKDRLGDAAVTIVGDDKLEARQASCDRFQRDPQCKVILGSFGAMGVGWTLTASSRVIFIEGDWVPGNLSQSEDRAHRMGQRDTVTAEHLVLADSIDATILKRVVSKQEMIDRALDAQAVPDEVEDAPIEKNSTMGTTRDQLAAEAAKITPQQAKAIHTALQRLSAVCNGAMGYDDHGFNKMDTRIGKDLASRQFLTFKQAALGRKICRKYRRQLGEEIYAAMGFAA